MLPGSPGGGALADDPSRRRSVAVGGDTVTAVLSGLIGAAGSAWQVGVLRAGAWTSRGLRVPAGNALLADVVPKAAYGRAYGFERAMGNFGAIGGPLLAIALVALVGVRSAILLSIIPGLLAPAAIVYAIRHTAAPQRRERQPIKLRVRPLLHGELGRLMVAIGAFEAGNLAATLMILRASELLRPGCTHTSAVQRALVVYAAYNAAATLASRPDAPVTGSASPESSRSAPGFSCWPTSAWPSRAPVSRCLAPASLSLASRLAALKPTRVPPSRTSHP